MADEDAANAAIAEFNGQDYDGRNMVVSELPARTVVGLAAEAVVVVVAEAVVVVAVTTAVTAVSSKAEKLKSERVKK